MQGAGVEDLYLSGGSQDGGNVEFANAKECWLRNVESDLSHGPSVSLWATFRCEVRDSFIHSTQSPQPGGQGYGISFAMHAADNLVENCIVWSFNKVMVMRAAGGGNVIGYNYFEDGWIDFALGWVESGMNAAHLTGTHSTL